MVVPPGNTKAHKEAHRQAVAEARAHDDAIKSEQRAHQDAAKAAKRAAKKGTAGKKMGGSSKGK